MNPIIKNFICQFYILIKRDFWIINAANLAAGITIFLFKPHALLQAALIFFLFLKTISFVRNSNIMPSISADFDRFSWKYFQGLPLSKKEIIHALVLTNFLVVSPMLIWVLSFLGPLTELFFDGEGNNFIQAIQFILYSVPVLLLIGLWAIKNQITFPRRQYSKNDPRIVFYSSVKAFLMTAAIGIYGLLFYAWFVSKYDLNIVKVVWNSIPDISSEVKIWSFPFILAGLSVLAYRSTLHTWQIEKIGYLKINWVPKRDLSIIAVSAFMLAIPFYTLDFATPLEFRDPLHKAVYKAQYKRINQLLAKGHKINKTNKYGVAPIHVAVYSSNFKMLKYLEDKGADIHKELVTKKGVSNILHIAARSKDPVIVKYLLSKKININVKNEVGNTPLHLATNSCRSEIIDILIQNGALIDSQNNRGETALHYASKNGCFSGVTALIEANANTDFKDEKGKLALDYAKNGKPDLAYYIEKKSRVPAGKITP